MRLIYCLLLIVSTSLQAQKQLPVIVVGMTHDHVHGILQFHKQNRVNLLAIVETDKALIKRHQNNYQLPDSLFYPTLQAALKKHTPKIVLAFNAIDEHLKVVEECAPRKIAVMVEKPLATTVADAEKMAALSAKYQVPVLVNYETTWYKSNHEVKKEIAAEKIGAIRKVVVHSGHEGPKEIGCSAEFLAWLTDPVKNGGGASRDFGCYGANLMTWLMNGTAPVSVSATIQQYKPDVYPKVDDVATIVLEYPNATCVIEASWNWPYSIKDMEVFGSKAYIQAVNGETLRFKQAQNKAEEYKATTPYFPDFISYLDAYFSNDSSIDKQNDLSSLNNNVMVVKILEAATRSAKEGRKINIK